MSKKYHPDINKEKDAQDKFKKINEAHSILKAGKENSKEDMEESWNPFQGFDPFQGFGGFGFQNAQINEQPENISVSTKISFKESVLGCKKDLKFIRKVKCNDCDGQGHSIIENGCKACNGKGRTVTRQGNAVYTQSCTKCNGKVSVKKCVACASKGNIKADAAVSVTIPAGIQNGNALRLAGMGNFVPQFNGSTDVFLSISVEPDKNLRLEGNDVICELNISLLEALKGCTKKVPTVLGDKDLNVKPLSKNKQFVSMPNLGVPKKGSQLVKLNVSYPDDVSGIINVLEGK